MTHLVVALAAEARPLVAHYSLQEVFDGSPFRVFEGEAMRLIISGVGKTAAASAVAYLFALTGQPRHRAWLNVGIAGHATRPVGDPLLANKITDQASGRSWLLPSAFEPPCDCGEIRTVDRPESEYLSDAAYDMEAAGFFDMASRLVTPELVQVLKVVSDNRDQGPEGVSARAVEAVIQSRLETVDRVAAACNELA